MHDDEDMREDDRDAEAQVESARSQAQFHGVTLDVTVRIRIDVMGATHETDDVWDMVTDTALSAGEIQNVEEV